MHSWDCTQYCICVCVFEAVARLYVCQWIGKRADKRLRLRRTRFASALFISVHIWCSLPLTFNSEQQNVRAFSTECRVQGEQKMKHSWKKKRRASARLWMTENISERPSLFSLVNQTKSHYVLNTMDSQSKGATLTFPSSLSLVLQTTLNRDVYEQHFVQNNE